MAILVPSRTDAGAGTVNLALPLKNASQLVSATFLWDVTALADDVDDTFDLFLQDTLDGVAYDDFAHFTQVLGNAAASKRLITVNFNIIATTPERAPAAGALAVGVRQGPCASVWRASLVTVDPSGTDASISWSLALVAAKRIR